MSGTPTIDPKAAVTTAGGTFNLSSVEGEALFGALAPPPGAAVPEPATILPFLLGLTVLAWRRSASRSRS